MGILLRIIFILPFPCTMLHIIFYLFQRVGVCGWTCKSVCTFSSVTSFIPALTAAWISSQEELWWFLFVPSSEKGAYSSVLCTGLSGCQSQHWIYGMQPSRGKSGVFFPYEREFCLKNLFWVDSLLFQWVNPEQISPALQYLWSLALGLRTVSSAEVYLCGCFPGVVAGSEEGCV